MKTQSHRTSLRQAVRCGLVAALAVMASAADGPGLGNLTYQPSEVGTVLGRFNSNNGAPLGHSFTFMHRGYMWVPFTNDGGGGNGNGGLSVYNVVDPRAPINVFTTVNHPYYQTSGTQSVTAIRESHSVTISGDVACFNTNGNGVTGIEFWNLENPIAPQKVSRFLLPGINGGDYDNTPWWSMWQGRRLVYVAGCDSGIYIVDASNPASPFLVNRGNGLPNPVPNSQLGGFRVNVLWAIGNLMVLSNANQLNGLSVLDISDPLNPQLLTSTTTTSVGYSCYVAGDRIYGCHNPARVWDISDPNALVLLGNGINSIDTGGYGALQDNHFIYGSSAKVVKMKIDQAPPFPYTLNVAPNGFSGTDWDFAMPMGNLMWAGNDHGGGSGLVVHQAAPDTTGPSVTMISPKAGSSMQALTSRVGIVFSDIIDGSSLSNATITVRPTGGEAIPGTYSSQLGVANFWPDSPLLEGTTYEVLVTSGGVKDIVGNGAISFSSTFSTIGTIPNPNAAPGIDVPAQATPGNINLP